MGKLHKQAKELLQAASKVYHYRRDVIPEGRLGELDHAVGEVQELSKKGADAKALEASMERLDALLRKIGGKIYPKTFWNDNLEVGLVAAILVIGVRTFFFQPFIIPTNSMYPTYSGMNAVIYEEADESPSKAQKVINKLTLGASHFNAVSPVAGKVKIPVFSHAPNSPDRELRSMGFTKFEIVSGRKWFGVLPAKKREYTFYVDETPVKIQVPFEFNLDELIQRAFFPETTSIFGAISSQHDSRQINVLGVNPMLQTDHEVAPGESVVEFDITLGDALFVDRVSYHFVRPKAGDPFVFRTRDIPGIEGGKDNIVDKYYIKRIGGVGGETLEIVDGTLLVDGTPRDEVEAFGRNSRRDEEYHGYINGDLLGVGRKLAIPEKKFVALGDNSGNSLDSRYWGFVPEKSVIGKAIFIYYPFTKRWGLAE